MLDVACLLLLFQLIKDGETLPVTSPEINTRLAEQKSCEYSPSTEFPLVLPLYGLPAQGFTLEVSIGGCNASEGQLVHLLVDTGSVVTGLADRFPCGRYSVYDRSLSQTLKCSSDQVSVHYPVDDWTGDLCQDTIHLGDGSFPADLGLMTKEHNFCLKKGLSSGIIGAAYPRLSSSKKYKTPFLYSLFQTWKWDKIFALQLCLPVHFNGLNIDMVGDSRMSIGGVTPDMLAGDIHYVEVTEAKWFIVQLLNIEVAGIPVASGCSAINMGKTIVDSGSPNTYLHEDLFNQVSDLIKSEVEGKLEVPDSFWKGGSRLVWPVDDEKTLLSVFPVLQYTLKGERSEQSVTFSLPPRLYLDRYTSNDNDRLATNCAPECHTFEFGIRKQDCGNLLGSRFLSGFTAIFDMDQNRIGFAPSPCFKSDKRQIRHDNSSLNSGCEEEQCSTGLEDWEITVYTCGAITVSLSIISIAIAVGTRLQGSECCRNTMARLTALMLFMQKLCCLQSEYSRVPMESIDEIKLEEMTSEL